jgi:hypothetical protein
MIVINYKNKKRLNNSHFIFAPSHMREREREKEIRGSSCKCRRYAEAGLLFGVFLDFE